MDKHDERYNGTYPAAAGAQPDPAQSHTAGDHRPGQAQAHPEQESSEGQGAEMADQGVGGIVGDEHGPVGDHLHIAGRTDLRGGEEDAEIYIIRLGPQRTDRSCGKCGL